MPLARIRTVLLLALCGAGLACTRTADIDFPPHTPALVVHGYAALGDTISISVGHTIAADRMLPDSLARVTTARAALFVDGVFADSLRYSASARSYRSKVAAQAGRIYTVRVAADGFGTVEAESKAPQPLAPALVTRTKFARQSTSGAPLDDVRFQFADPAGEHNYYLVALYPAPRYPDMGFLCLYSVDPSIERPGGDLLPFDPNSCTGTEELLLTDRSFDGQVKSVLVSGDSYQLFEQTDIFTGTRLRPYVQRYSINEEYYRYFKTTVGMGYNTGPSFVDPVVVKGNVRNGDGVFTVYARIADSIP